MQAYECRLLNAATGRLRRVATQSRFWMSEDFQSFSKSKSMSLDGSPLVPPELAFGKAGTAHRKWRIQMQKPLTGQVALSIEQMLSAARARLRRLSPDEAHEAMVKTGAILVDIRPQGQRSIEGSIAGALVVERNVLEWRFDPTSNARLPVATDHGIQLIVFCSEGYSSSLAAISLQDIGLWRATDMIGGFQEWKSMRLPIVPPGETS